MIPGPSSLDAWPVKHWTDQVPRFGESVTKTPPISWQGLDEAGVKVWHAWRQELGGEAVKAGQAKHPDVKAHQIKWRQGNIAWTI